MNRRSFLASVAAALVLDPERALWVPGKKLISIPKPRPPIDFEPWFQVPFEYNAAPGGLKELWESSVLAFAKSGMGPDLSIECADKLVTEWEKRFCPPMYGARPPFTPPRP